MEYKIFIPFNSKSIESDLSIRYAISDEIDESIGYVIEEGTSEEGTHIFFNSDQSVLEIEKNLSYVIEEFGIQKFTIYESDD